MDIETFEVIAGMTMLAYKPTYSNMKEISDHFDPPINLARDLLGMFDEFDNDDWLVVFNVMRKAGDELQNDFGNLDYIAEEIISYLGNLDDLQLFEKEFSTTVRYRLKSLETQKANAIKDLSDYVGFLTILEGR